MTSDLWIGAAATLAGAMLGGAISYILSHQQMKYSREQRIEDDQRQKLLRSEDRRFTAYADFITKARSYRNAIQPLHRQAHVVLDNDHLGNLAASADAASSLVFLVVESPEMYEASRAVVAAINTSQEIIRDIGQHPDDARGREANDLMALRLREFQAAARKELGVTGVERSRILDNISGMRADRR
jgi:hypothetical protein